MKPLPTETSVSKNLANRLISEIDGDVLFDTFSKGRYATDASIYQIDPIGVTIPSSNDDIRTVMAIAADAGVSVLPRGGGTSQCGQTVGHAVVIDVSHHLNQIIEFDPDEKTAWVEPGVVLDELNNFLKPHGLWFPVDVSTGSRATIGGMTGNNSCGARSLHYGTMRDNVIAIDAVLANGTEMHFGELPADTTKAGFAELDYRASQLLLEIPGLTKGQITCAVQGHGFNAIPIETSLIVTVEGDVKMGLRHSRPLHLSSPLISNTYSGLWT